MTFHELTRDVVYPPINKTEGGLTYEQRMARMRTSDSALYGGRSYSGDSRAPWNWEDSPEDIGEEEYDSRETWASVNERFTKRKSEGEYDADGYDEGGHFDKTKVRRMYSEIVHRCMGVGK